MIATYQKIEVEYPDEQLPEAQKLYKVIGRNKQFIQTFVGNKISFIKEKEDWVYIPTTFDLIDDIYESFQEESLKTNQNQIIESLYFNLLIKKYGKEKDLDQLLEEDYQGKDERYIYCCMAPFYYKTKEEFRNFMVDYSDKEEEKILEWARKSGRMDAFNSILEITLEGIKTYEKHAADYTEVCGTKLEEEYPKIEEINHSFTPLSENELIVLYESFLKEIDPSLQWFQKFQEAKENNKIIFINVEKSETENSSYATKEKVYIERNGNTHDIKILAHEFTHYIQFQNDYGLTLLDELSSIYYETKALEYLKNVGISEEEISSLKQIRINISIQSYQNLEKILEYLRFYKKEKSLTLPKVMKKIMQDEEEQKPVEFIEYSPRMNHPQPEVIDILVENDEDYESLYESKAKDQIDGLTTLLIKLGGPRLGKANFYIIGTYLSNWIIKQECENEVQKMIYITKNIEKLDFNDIRRIIESKKDSIKVK